MKLVYQPTKAFVLFRIDPPMVRNTGTLRLMLEYLFSYRTPRELEDLRAIDGYT